MKNLNTVLEATLDYYYCTYGVKNKPSQTSARPYKNVLAFVASYRISTYIFDLPEERMVVLLGRDITVNTGNEEPEYGTSLPSRLLILHVRREE
jgi:hypothetical protein